MGTKQWIVILSLAGTLFAGYYAGTKFFSSVCPFNESCPLFFGQPACYFGFVLFFALLVMSLLWWKRDMQLETAILSVAGLGVLFAGYLSLIEIMACVNGICSYALILPTCAYGLFFYIAIFTMMWKMR